MNNELFLSEKQYMIIEVVLKTGEIEVSKLASVLNESSESLMRDLVELESKELIVIERKVAERIVLTPEGLNVLEKGLPEERLYNIMYRCIDRSVNDFINCSSRETEMDQKYVNIGLQILVREKCLDVINGKVVVGNEINCFKVIENAAWLKSYLSRISIEQYSSPDLVSVLKRRRMIRIEKKTLMFIKPTSRLRELFEKNLIKKKELITVVKPIYARELDKYTIKEFDLTIQLPRLKGSKSNSYMEFLELVRDILVSMGFEEVKGPHVELEFWNFDALFQAQDHPAREIHDTFYVNTDFTGRVDEELLKRASEVHSRGWRYSWDPFKALKPVLRTQTTAVSARELFKRGCSEYRVFTIDRVFRPETLDAKHAMEFYQVDGLIVSRDVNFKHLLAFFREFSAAIGVREIWFKPGYFPFTEPSVEGYVKHPSLGWIEVFPGGMLRPEVLQILGVDGVRVAAWAIGIDRLAMVSLGLDDIRDLFSKDLDFLRKIPLPKLPYFNRKTSGLEVIVVKTPL
uniref:phenylalanine--tRNA ligase n=1 Tax=Staphylothermus marinus TaxID=2280 RepID=A0A7C4HB94_STAMA